MKKYPKYKDTYFLENEEIPEHWSTRSLGSISTQKSVTNNTGKELLSVFLDRGVIKFDDDHSKRTNGTSKDLSKYQLVEVGDFVLNNQQAWRGSVGVSSYEGIVSPAYIVLSLSKELNSSYANYLLRSPLCISQYAVNSKGVGSIQRNLYWDKLKLCKIPLPPYQEQVAIVTYLNKKNIQIDKLIFEAKKEINLLNELKQAEIAHMVTRGLNPNVQMKDSGITWIRKIPAHWQLRKMKFLFEERTEKNHPNEPILCSTQAYGVIPQSLYDNRVVVVNTGFENLKLVEEGDFVISLRSFQGGIEYAHYRGIISAAYTILRSNGVLSNDYTRYLFKCFPFIQLLKTCVKGIREGQNINYDMLRNNFLFIPPKEEQKAIVSAIDENNKKIDTLTFQLSNQITYLKELKQRVISDAVTGKIDVRDYKN